MTVKIFYSWQATTNSKYNKNFISTCIKEAVKKINQIPEFKRINIEVTDAVRSESGQVAIADTIIEKVISNSDIFIADLTIVNWDIPDSIPDEYREVFKKAQKPIPNPNVMLEYGAALKVLGKNAIISILNIYSSGSPKEKNNAEIIPFDLRHDRFPTEYNYSSHNESQKAEIKKNLVFSLVSVLKPTIQNVLETQKSKFRPFITWNEWNEIMKSPQSEKFFTNSKILEVQNSILLASNLSTVTRLLGLSGIGKTRILLETFRPKENDIDFLISTNRVLYVNCNDYPNQINFSEIISKIKNEKEDAILIVDNCDISTHKLIARNLRGLTLITIDSNPEENSNKDGTNYIVIGKNELSDIVTQLVDSNFQNIGEANLKRIKDFSQGIPFMAVLLGESVKNGEKFIGKLDDKDILDKLLGTKGKEQEWRNILKSCSLFSYFGFENELESQYKFIATNQNITISNNTEHVRTSTFLDVIMHFEARGIIEKKGRYLSIRPFPLSMALAIEWLDTCTSDRILQVIVDITKLEEPHRTTLINSLAEQMKYLGYNDKAIQIVEKIVGPHSPFDNAEVLNTELGSRLFRSFVEVNPIAVSRNFKRQFLLKPTDELLKIVEGRRNIIWTLEKLCFDKRTFSDGAKVLLKFAIAENETWTNNATGQFLQLFSTHLSGTEADLNERWKIIKWALDQNDKQYDEIALKAMNRGLKFGQFSRMGGAEYQGGKRLIDNEPTSNELEDYWNNIFYTLITFVKVKNDYLDWVSETIASNIRPMFHFGMGSIIIPILKEVSEIRDNKWDNGLQGLKYTRKYERNFITEKQLDEINSLINQLTQTDFLTRYKNLSNSMYLEDDETYSTENLIVAIRELADEFINEHLSWDDTFIYFFKNHQFSSFHFGKRLAEILQNDQIKINHFIEYSLECILRIPQQERNFNVLGGFISNLDAETKEKFYLKLYASSELSNQLFYFLSIDKSGKDYFHLLFNLIESNICSVSSFLDIRYNYGLSQLSIEELNDFSESLFSYGDEGYSIIFILFYDLGWRNESIKTRLISIYKKCIVRLSFNQNLNLQLDYFKWAEVISFIISNQEEVDFAQQVNRLIINSIARNNLYQTDYDIQSVYKVLIRVHFHAIWNDLSIALLSNDENYFQFYSLKHILGSRIGGFGRNVGILFDGNIDAIFQWCENNQPLAPSRLAELTPIFDNNNTDYTKWHPVANRLIDEYGNIRDVLSNISSNMGTYSWVGSVVPFLEAKKELFEQLCNHQIENVREWASSYVDNLEKDIARERNKDEEDFI